MSVFIILQGFRTDKSGRKYIYIKELLYNALSVSRFTVSTEQSINAPLLSLATDRKSKTARVKYIFFISQNEKVYLLAGCETVSLFSFYRSCSTQ